MGVSSPLPLLALFSQRLGDSRHAELEAVAGRLGARRVAWSWDDRQEITTGGDRGPAVLQPLPRLAEEDLGWLGDAAARAVACRGAFEVWGAGDTIEACAEATTRVPAGHLLRRVDGAWRVDSVVLGARRSLHGGDLGARMRAFRHVLDTLSARPVDLDRPRHRLVLLEDRRGSEGRSGLPGPSPRYRLLFMLPTRRPPVAELVHALDLRARAFLSTSSLPADRALCLCNLALAGAPLEDAGLLDPFCGSGSILLAGAALGAWTVGSDLDWRLVSDRRVPVEIPATARRPERGVEAVRMRDNFDEAGLPPPLALLALDVGAPDAAARLLSASGGRRFHALVCDPPYGRREFQQGSRAWDGALTFKVDAAAQDLSLGILLDLAQATLRPGGRLVFLAPVRAPHDPHKPTEAELRRTLGREGPRRGLHLVHLGVEEKHRGLHRAVVVMEEGGGA